MIGSSNSVAELLWDVLGSIQLSIMEAHKLSEVRRGYFLPDCCDELLLKHKLHIVHSCRREKAQLGTSSSLVQDSFTFDECVANRSSVFHDETDGCLRKRDELLVLRKHFLNLAQLFGI